MGYNVFRSMNSGGPYTKINFRLDPRTKFVDARVGAGNTYYYVTTAVDSHGHQSAPSNEVAARVLLTQ
jgi:fibronectin type 3 domain-containing protein